MNGGEVVNKFLDRDGAPLEGKTWNFLDETLIKIAKSQMAGRRVLDIEGPYGLGFKSVSLGDEEARDGMTTSKLLPLINIHRSFNMTKRDLAAFEANGIPPNLSGIANAAMECARLEDDLIFNGMQGIPGLMNAPGSTEYKLNRWDEVGTGMDDIIRAVTLLDERGFHGPYALALCPSLFNIMLRKYPPGFGTEMDHVKNIVTQGIVKAPVLKQGGMLMACGWQFACLVIGQDMSLGFVGPDGQDIEFSVSESIVPLIRVPRSICILKEQTAKAKA